MKNAAPQSPSSSFAALALGAGLTDGHATVVLRPVAAGGLAAELRAAVAGVRGVGLVRVVRHEGDVVELAVSTTRPVALASELRVALRRPIVSCSAVAGRLVVVLDGEARSARQTARPRFDHRVASAVDRAMGLDVYAPLAEPAARRRPRTAHAAPVVVRTGVAHPEARRVLAPRSGRSAPALPAPTGRPLAPSAPSGRPLAPSAPSGRPLAPYAAPARQPALPAPSGRRLALAAGR